jgi:hypothetical protein
MPEWFTVDLDSKYVLKSLTTGSETVYTGKQLHEGVPLELQAGIEKRLLLNVTPVKNSKHRLSQDL